MPVSSYTCLPMRPPLSTLSSSSSPSPSGAGTVVQCRGLSVECGRKTVLDDVDMDLKPGITCLIGRNGAGKTTLLRVLCGILRPSFGQVRVLGVDPLVAGSARRAVGYLTHRPSLNRSLTVRDNLHFWARILGLDWEQGADRVDELVRRFELRGKLDQRAGTLSRGQQRRVAIVRVLLSQPRLILMDEPGTGLDALALRELHTQIEELADDGVSAIYATHALDEAVRLGDQFLLLAGGTTLHIDRHTEPREPAVLADRLLQRLICLGDAS